MSFEPIPGCMCPVLALMLAVCGCAGSSHGTRPGGACGTPTGGSGIATYYNATGAGACSFDATPDNMMVVSMNAVDYGTSEWCGACLEVEGPTGKTITVRVVDECPECPKGNIDLSAQAFAQLSPLEVGGVAVKWHEVACNVTGPIAYHFKDGSNWTWAAIQLRNHRYPIATVEAKDANGTYKNIPRVVYNFFVSTSLGYGPYSLRVTDVHGHQVVDDDIHLGDNVTQQGTAQLPACRANPDRGKDEQPFRP